MDVLRTKETKALLDAHPELFKPRILWKWFLWATEVPRGSGSVGAQRMRDELVKIGRRMGLDTKVDTHGNVRITKPATHGYESAPGVILQCHYDMVVAHDSSRRPAFDCDKDAIAPELREEDAGWLYAHGTSLGADDGIGVATCLAVLEDAGLEHPAIDCLFTADEETTMSGAHGVEPALLLAGGGRPRFLINVDSEDDSELCLGCAGGETVTVRFRPEWSLVELAESAAVRVSVRGFAGGHTGVDIHKGHANAIRELCLVVATAASRVAPAPVRLAELEGGKFCNAIPVSASCVVVLPKGASADAFSAAALAAFDAVRRDYAGIETPASLAADLEVLQQLPAQALDVDQTRKVLDFWALAPCNPLRMSPDIAGFVETSCAFTIAKLRQADTAAEFTALARTSRDSQWADVDRRMEALAGIVGGTFKATDHFAGWQPQPSSTLAKVAQEAHVNVFGKPCLVRSIHAGLECGVIMNKVPGLEAISIGPKIENPHTINERVNIKTVETYYAWLTRIIRLLN